MCGLWPVLLYFAAATAFLVLVLPPLPSGSGARQGRAIGRYQLGAAGEGAPLILDTATGRVWRMVDADAGARWEMMPAVPEGIGEMGGR